MSLYYICAYRIDTYMIVLCNDTELSNLALHLLCCALMRFRGVGLVPLKE